ncbi:MAG: PAS domain S-box protein [Planctomycetes bacterium]|nr:PAS domain S-box protein [Planctomycetota bacterium]
MPDRLHRLRIRFCHASGVFVALMGSLGLLGWILDIAALRSILPGLATMKPNTCIAFILAGFALFLLQQANSKHLGKFVALIVVLISVLSLLEYAGVQVGIDELLFEDPESTTAPGRMSLATTIFFLLLGTALAFLHRGLDFYIPQGLAALGFLGSSLTLIAYLYGVDDLYRVAPFSSISLHTAASFFILSLGVLAACPDRGLIGLLASSGQGGILARRLLPVAFLGPIFLGWLRLLGQRQGWYGLEFGVALFALSTVAMFTVFILWTAIWIERTDRERRQIALTLKQNDRHVRELMDSLPQLIWICRSDGYCEFFSRQWMEYTGATEEEHLGFGWADVVNPDDRVIATERWNRSVATGEPYEAEIRIRDKSKTYRWFKAGATLLPSSGTGPRKWIGTNTDIDDRKRAESQLRELNATLEQKVIERTVAAEERSGALAASEAAFRNQSRVMNSILQSMGEGVAVADRDGTLTIFNKEAEHILGLGLKEIHATEWSDTYGLFDPTTKQPCPVEKLPLYRALLGEVANDCELFVRNPRHPEGRYIIVTGRPIFSELGVLEGGVAVFRDVTARRQADEELRESRERFQNAFEHTSNGMALLSVDGRWLKVNSALCRIVGRTSEELLATTFQAITHPEDLEPDLQYARKLLAGEISNYQIEKRYFHKDGHIVWIILNGSIVRDTQGKPLYCIAHVQDITERKLTEERMLASLEEKQVLLREIHHRVKNNLQVISSLLDLQSQYSKDPATVEMFRESQNRVRSMALVHERLYQSETLANIDFANYLGDLVGYLSSTYRVDTGMIHFELDLEPVHLSIDSAVPCGLLVNELVSNCLKYAFPNQREGNVWLSLVQTGDDVILTVQDDGVGLAEEITLRNSKTFGLRLVAALTEQLHGVVKIDRTQGTSVQITFPAMRDKAKKATQK